MSDPGDEMWGKMPTLKCDVCGRFISWADFNSEKAMRRLNTPDSQFSREEYDTVCPKCLPTEVR
ncbi:MAG: hypothetical protein KGL39_12220 [Patescibacteria group bacterium]|nr:hypothetical protein [Patescibacteria group bacterium]